MAPPARLLPVLDVFGGGSAVLCALHCAISGIFLAVLPLAGLGALLDERVEMFFIALSIGLGLISLGMGWWTHRRPAPLCLLLLGMVSLLVLRPQVHEGSSLELTVVLLGASLLVMAHCQNQRYSRIAIGAAVPQADVITGHDGTSVVTPTTPAS